ncbi:MAG: cadherin-like domain-containing protein, partial [Candidatus Anammoximicrobium sp.]|nr:cadherin-like domain-containing protein [Candidatus Anammoximicrobium sp.]
MCIVHHCRRQRCDGTFHSKGLPDPSLRGERRASVRSIGTGISGFRVRKPSGGRVGGPGRGGAAPQRSLTVSAIAQPGHGTVELNGDGNVTYAPAAEFFGLDQFTYTIQDLLGGSSTATVSVRVNRPPDAVDDAV